MKNWNTNNEKFGRGTTLNDPKFGVQSGYLGRKTMNQN